MKEFNQKDFSEKSVDKKYLLFHDESGDYGINGWPPEKFNDATPASTNQSMVLNRSLGIARK